MQISRALCSAIGHQGKLYEFEGRLEDAATLTRRALHLAQQIQAPDFVYLWQWQIGRILLQTGAVGWGDFGLSAGRLFVAIDTERHAIRYGNQNARSSFPRSGGRTVYGAGGLLFRKAASEKEAAVIQALLLEARDTAELLKAAELEDYFQDDCVNLLKAKKRKVDQLSKTALVVYIVPLPDRTEVLLSLPRVNWRNLRRRFMMKRSGNVYGGSG